MHFSPQTIAPLGLQRMSKIPDIPISHISLNEVVQSTTTCNPSFFPLAWVCPKSYYEVHKSNMILFQHYVLSEVD